MNEPQSLDQDVALARSWERNADAWTRAVREGQIPSRRAGTDAAVVASSMRALERRGSATRRVLDVGCGEGWLARELAERGCEVVGVDGSLPLVEHASAHAAPREGRTVFHHVTYAELERQVEVQGGPFDVLVLNFALLAEEIAPLLAALRGYLAPGGALVIQTVHPWTAAGDAGYVDGWRLETFSSFGGSFSDTMPWYFRTLASWLREVTAAGLHLETLEEPTDPASGRPLSLLLTCRAT